MSLFKRLSTSFGLAAAFIGLLTLSASADTIGVGVGTGKIGLNEALKPGLTYTLPSIAVFNNGDVAAEYKMSMQFNEKQPQFKPEVNWVKFTPESFHLEPGKSRLVNITLRTASSAHPGDYFAYLEAHPLKKDKNGKTAINIAAATKLSFRVAPANIFQKLFYFLQDLWNRYKQIIIPVTSLLAAAGTITYVRRNLSFNIQKKQPQPAAKSVPKNKKTGKKGQSES